MATAEDLTKLTNAIKSLDKTIRVFSVNGGGEIGFNSGGGSTVAEKRKTLTKRRDTMSGFESTGEEYNSTNVHVSFILCTFLMLSISVWN